jgi:hypothetical protein
VVSTVVVVVAEAAGVWTLVETLAEPLELTVVVADVEAAGVDTLALALVCVTFELTLAWVEPAGVEALPLTETDEDEEL